MTENEVLIIECASNKSNKQAEAKICQVEGVPQRYA